MNKKFVKVLAIIALVFVALFSVALVLTLLDKTMFNGAIGYFTLVCGVVGVGLFFVVRVNSVSIRTAEKLEEEEKNASVAARQKTIKADEPSASEESASEKDASEKDEKGD